MSGHSHFSSIKHKKGAADEKRGKVFSKISKIISMAAKERGGDPKANSKLRLAVEQAKQANMPKDNIDRAIKKGTGEIAGEKLEEFIFEAYGPGKTAIIIQGITDNKNRTFSEIKQILNQNNGKLASEGSVKWLFERKGVITLQITNSYEYTNKENLELTIIEAGAEDIQEQDEFLYIYTKPEDLEKVKKNLEEKGVKIESASLNWVSKENIGVGQKEKESCEKLFEALDENDAVQDIYSNLKT